MHICLLTTQDLDADPFPEDDWPCDPRPFMPEASWTVATLTGKANSVKQVEALIDSGKYDLFFVTVRPTKTFLASKSFRNSKNAKCRMPGRVPRVTNPLELK